MGSDTNMRSKLLRAAVNEEATNELKDILENYDRERFVNFVLRHAPSGFGSKAFSFDVSKLDSSERAVYVRLATRCAKEIAARNPNLYPPSPIGMNAFEDLGYKVPLEIVKTYTPEHAWIQLDHYNLGQSMDRWFVPGTRQILEEIVNKRKAEDPDYADRILRGRGFGRQVF